MLGLDPNALNYGLKTTMNSDEAVARGGALQAAMLSSRMKVRVVGMHWGVALAGLANGARSEGGRGGSHSHALPSFFPPHHRSPV